MSLLKSAVNQVGRDLGKVASNKIFKNSHSTPYRRTSAYSGGSRINKSTFEKSLDFQNGMMPKTLINKTMGAFTELKNEIDPFLSDGYLDVDECDKMFEIIGLFNNKLSNIIDVLDIDEEGNSEEIKKLNKIIELFKGYFNEVLAKSAQGCQNEAEIFKAKANKISYVSKGKFIGHHIIWMGKYIRGAKKNMVKTVLANIFDVVTLLFLWTRPFLFLKGLITYSGYKTKKTEEKKSLENIANIELKRANYYTSIITE